MFRWTRQLRIDHSNVEYSNTRAIYQVIYRSRESMSRVRRATALSVQRSLSARARAREADSRPWKRQSEQTRVVHSMECPSALPSLPGV